MYSLITLPDPTSILSNSAPWFNAWFAEFLPYLYIGVGVITAFIMIRWLVNHFIVSTIRMTRGEHRRNKGDQIHYMDWTEWKKIYPYGTKADWDHATKY